MPFWLLFGPFWGSWYRTPKKTPNLTKRDPKREPKESQNGAKFHTFSDLFWGLVFNTIYTSKTFQKALKLELKSKEKRWKNVSPKTSQKRKKKHVHATVFQKKRYNAQLHFWYPSAAELVFSRCRRFTSCARSDARSKKNILKKTSKKHPKSIRKRSRNEGLTEDLFF